MEANHTLRNAFSSDLDLPKSKLLNHGISFSRALALIAIVLAPIGSPVKSFDKSFDGP